MRLAPSVERHTKPGLKTKKALVPILVNPWREPLTFESGLKLFDELKCVASSEEQAYKFGAIKAASKPVLQRIAKKLSPEVGRQGGERGDEAGDLGIEFRAGFWRRV
jgi:hypothetical protein